MKVEFFDGDLGSELLLTPETMEETAALLRFSSNASAQKPEIYLSFYKNIYCNVWIKKRKTKVTSIKP